jgi:hypothetical protein
MLCVAAVVASRGRPLAGATPRGPAALLLLQSLKKIPPYRFYSKITRRPGVCRKLLGWKHLLISSREWRVGVEKDNDYCLVSFPIFLLPSLPSVLLTSLRSAQANTHALIFFFNQIPF